MSLMTKEEIEAAMDQITNCVVSVIIPRLSPHKIEELTRPQKRRAKKRYANLDFNDDKEYFAKACSLENYYPEKRYYRKRRKAENSEPMDHSYLAFDERDEDRKPDLRQLHDFFESGPLRTAEESTAIALSGSKMEVASDEPRNATVSKIRIKSAAELGSTIVFVDIPKGCEATTAGSQNDGFQQVLFDIVAQETDAYKLTDKTSDQLDIQKLFVLYKQLFTSENQQIIKKVADILQRLSDGIKEKNDKLMEITNSRSTDAEKLMLRHQAHGVFNRIKDKNHTTLKRQFEALEYVFDGDGFEILFQLFFLGILRTIIASVASKRGTLFKKVVSLLLQSLGSCNYRNERVMNLLRSKDFRGDCIAMVRFIEKCSETKFFEMLFVSEAEKAKQSHPAQGGRKWDASGVRTASTTPSVVRYSSDMKLLRVGHHLFLHDQPPPPPPSTSSVGHQRKAVAFSKANFSKSKVGAAAAASKPLKILPISARPAFTTTSSSSILASCLPPPIYQAAAPVYQPAPAPPPPSFHIAASNFQPSYQTMTDNTRLISDAGTHILTNALRYTTNSASSAIVASSAACVPFATHSISATTMCSSSFPSLNTLSNISFTNPICHVTPTFSSVTPTSSAVSSATSLMTPSFAAVPRNTLAPRYTPNVLTYSAPSTCPTVGRSQSVIVEPPCQAPSPNTAIPSPVMLNALVATVAAAVDESVQPAASQALNLKRTESSESQPGNAPEGSSCATPPTSLRTYGPAKETSRKVLPVPGTGSLPDTFPQFHAAASDTSGKHGGKTQTTTSTAPSEGIRPSTVPRTCDQDVASAGSDTVPSSCKFSAPQTTNISANDENIQPNSSLEYGFQVGSKEHDHFTVSQTNSGKILELCQY